MNHLPPRENTNFPLAVTNALEAVPKDVYLLPHQWMPVEFFTRYPKARGLLFMHETGSGKSISAVAIAEYYLSIGRRVVVVVAKTLQNNFRDNIIKFKVAHGMSAEDATAYVDRKYSFVSANANNMLAQLKRVSQPAELQEALDAPDGDEDSAPDADAVSGVNLEGQLVIVDEAHHLFNGIVSGSRNARGLYEIVMHTRDIRLLFLTSSVITNTPFELVPCFNMIAGYELLPVIYPDFVDMFISSKTGDIRNIDHFKSRIFGLVSYYGSWFETGGLLNIHSRIVRPHMPTRLPIREIMIPMSNGQYGAYSVARTTERQKKSYPTGKVKALSKPSSSGDTSYRIRSRQLSNFWIPEGVTFGAPIIADLPKYSPKMAALLASLATHRGQATMIYSAFLHTYGLEWIAAVLDANGFARYDPSDKSGANVRRYAFITGDMKIEERSAVLAALNSPENRDCSMIEIIFGSPAMSEGVDTKRIRHVYIFEPPWHFSAIDQIIARAVRLHSHDDLDEDARTVQPYIFLADYPADIVRTSTLKSAPASDATAKEALAPKKPVSTQTELDEPTTDVAMYYKSIRKKLISDKFFRALIEASIDCSVHIKAASAVAKKNIHCMMCAPDDKPMFIRDLNEDMAAPITCKQSVARDITVEEIIISGRKFYFRREDSGALHIFEYDEPTSSYVRLSPQSKWYKRVHTAITK